ncbi:MAG: thiamine pyrophosphate-dependent enzyme [Eubacteriales bacterium]|nr:thiamine pyrophosphate-dependent enzyme [Eubacteriales bacterium]
MSQIVYQRSPGLKDVETHYCPGCHHGIVHKLIAEVLTEMDLLDTAVGVCPVGCSVLAGNYINCDFIEAAHGRAPAVATGVKRTHPELPVFTYQGDGDLASIGTAEIVHATMRGEKFTTIFINNAIYGMTGGQMAPTTLEGQKSTTSQSGRDRKIHGLPVRMAEMLATLDGMAYAERVCVADIPSLNKAKRAIKKAFTLQQKGIGFTFIEVLSTCPTNWGMSPVEAGRWVQSTMSQYYPLGVVKDAEVPA